MTATPAEIRLAFEDFLNEVDARAEPFEWTLADIQREFGQWLDGRLPFEWNDLLNYEVGVAMSTRYQPYLSTRGFWFR